VSEHDFSLRVVVSGFAFKTAQKIASDSISPRGATLIL
jgi:hypothetical protein